VAGEYYIATDLGNGLKTNSDPSGFTSDMFVAKYSGTDGRCLFARTMGGAGNDSGAGIAHDPTTDSIIIGGGASSSTDFGGGPINTGSGVAAFVAGYGPAGNYLWVKTWGGSDSFAIDGVTAVAVDQSGSLAVTGSTGSGLDFGDGWISGAGYTVVNFTLAGNLPPVYQWAKRASYVQSGGNGVVFDGLGHVLTAGWMLSRIDFGGMTAGIVTPYNGAFVAQHMK
jgi:hypothetical protein